MERSKLPFRRNCEGYFFKEGNILAKDRGEFTEFPGGGVDDGETPEEALTRETFEETGAIVDNLQKVGDANFIWGKDWAKTDKQKERYKRFKGEEMHFFVGKIKELKETKHEDKWRGEIFMPIKEVINKLEG